MSKFKVEINRKWCKECHICCDFCPKDVLAPSAEEKIVVKDIDSCIGCKMCEYRCPDYAIKVEVNEL